MDYGEQYKNHWAYQVIDKIFDFCDWTIEQIHKDKVKQGIFCRRFRVEAALRMISPVPPDQNIINLLFLLKDE